MLKILNADFTSTTWFIILMIIVFFGIVALITWILYRVINREKLKQGNPQSPEEVAEEELERILRPFDPEDSINIDKNIDDNE